MRQKIGERAVHALIAFLLSAGIVLPVLGVLDDSFLSPGILLACAAIILIFEAASLHRIAAFSATGGLIIGLIIWLISAGGAQTMSDFMIAVTLRIRGIRSAVPLIREQAMQITACFLTALCCFACLRKATCVPSLVLCAGTAFLVWLTDRMDLIPWLLPALAAFVTMMLTSRFEETRPIRILPWAAGITAAAYLLAGSGMVLQPLKDMADELRQTIMERFFFVETRDVFSLYAIGYSPQGQNQLGGKPNPDSSAMMEVTTPRVTYLRGAIYDQYDGHAWQNTAGGKRYLWQSDRMENERASLFNFDLPAESVPNVQISPETVTVRMLNDSASTLFVPQRIRNLNPGGDMVPYYTNSTEIFITRNLRPGDTYEVSAPLYTSTDARMGQILELCSAMDDPMWDQMPDIYLQLPGHLSETLYTQVMKITEGAGTPYDRAMMIQNWLNRNFQYTLDVGEHPDNIDFVTSFLMDTKKGYCTYFASAMTVLCRMAGLPARYVEGYLAEPDGNGEALVTGMDAHAWTEVYFKGFGWLTFDATPKQRRTFETDGNDEGGREDEQIPTPGPEEPTPTPEPEDEPTPEPDQPTPTPEPPENEPTPTPEDAPPDEEPTTEPPEDQPTPAPEEVPPDESPDPPSTPPDETQSAEPSDDARKDFPWIIMILLLLLATLIGRITMTSPAFRARHARSEEKRMNIWTQELYDLLAAENVTRRTDETPMGFARRVDAEGFFSTMLGPVGECVSLIRYSTVEPLETDTALVRETARGLRREMSRPARFRYWMRRIFLPLRKRDWAR